VYFDVFARDARLAVQQVFPHPFIELLAMAHGQGPFDRAARELAQHIGRDMKTEYFQEWT
jgi:hypothetical protein